MKYKKYRPYKAYPTEHIRRASRPRAVRARAQRPVAVEVPSAAPELVGDPSYAGAANAGATKQIQEMIAKAEGL